MIKDINENEILNLKENFKDLIKYKKLLVKKKQVFSFFNENLSFIDAIKIYMDFIFCKYKIKGYEIKDADNIILKYFIENNILDIKDANLIKELFIKNPSMDIDTFNYNVYDTLEEITSLLEDLCDKLGINLKYCSNSEFIEYEEVDKDFIFLKEDLLSVVNSYVDSENNNEMDEQERIDSLMDNFDDIFHDDARIFCFEGYKCNDNLLNDINKLISLEYEGFSTELFEESNNLYLSISHCSLYYGINIKFVLILICLLLNQDNYINIAV